jgi:hypothetical protein
MNPLRLNPLQLKTLTLFQHLAQFPESSTKNEENGEIMISNLPQPHGNHFHCGDAVVMSKDATGLQNEGVYKALQRKGLVRSFFPLGLALTTEGLEYETGLADKILHRSDH